MKLTVKNVLVLSDPTFRVNMQKWPKTSIFFVLMKGIFEILQAKNKYLHKVDTMSLHLIIIRPFAQFWIVNMTSLHSCSEGYVQQLGRNVLFCLNKRHHTSNES